MTVPRKKPGVGRINDERSFWIRLNARHEFVIYHGVYDEDTEPGEATRIMFHDGRRRFTINLSAYTEAELDGFEAFVAKAVEIARPTCQTRDAHAKEHWDNGDTSYTRMYREVPRLIARPRKKPQHDPSLPIGPDQFLESGDPTDNGGELGSASSDVAERGEEGLVPQDDGSEVDLGALLVWFSGSSNATTE